VSVKERPVLAPDLAGTIAHAGVDPTLEGRALQDALRAAIATRGGCRTRWLSPPDCLGRIRALRNTDGVAVTWDAGGADAMALLALLILGAGGPRVVTAAE
jgi:hypothetical protein